MAHTPDLNPGDLQARRHLMRRLRTLRTELGIQQDEVAAAMWVTEKAVSRFELRDPPNPRLNNIQRYARALSHTATFRLEGLPTVDLDTRSKQIHTTADLATDPERIDLAERKLILAQLRATRRHLGLTGIDVQKIMGGNIRVVENYYYEPNLATYQRYARALGGRLTVRIKQADIVDEVLVGRAVNGEPAAIAGLNPAEQVEVARQLLIRHGVGALSRLLNVSGQTAKRLAAQAHGEAA